MTCTTAAPARPRRRPSFSPDRRFPILAAAAALTPAAASAHAPAEGLEGLRAGALHLLTYAPSVLCLLALGLAFGLAPKTRAAALWALFAVTFLAGLGIAQAGLADRTVDGALLAAALVAGSAAAVAPGAASAAAALAVGGLAMGAASAPEPGGLAAVATTIAGSALAANLAVVYAGAGLRALRARFPYPWLPLGVRIAAAWTVAIAALLLALTVPRA